MKKPRLKVLENPLMHDLPPGGPCVTVIFGADEYDWWEIDDRTGDLKVGTFDTKELSPGLARESDVYMGGSGTYQTKHLIYSVARGMHAKVQEMWDEAETVSAPIGEFPSHEVPPSWGEDAEVHPLRAAPYIDQNTQVFSTYRERHHDEPREDNNSYPGFQEPQRTVNMSTHVPEAAESASPTSGTPLVESDPGVTP